MKKLLLIGVIILYSLIGICQNSISELQRGMVAHFPLNEWYPTKDLVSGTNGTATAVYNVPDRQGGGANRYYSFNGTSDYVTLPAIPAFGTSDFAVTAKIYWISGDGGIIGGGSSGFTFGVNSSGNLFIEKTAVGGNITTSMAISANTWTTVSVIRSGGTITFYKNTTTESGGTDANNYTVASTKLGCNYYGSGTPQWFSGYIAMVRVFNYAASIANYSKPEYPIEYSDRDGAGNLCVLNLAAEGLAKASDGSYNVGYWTDRVNSITATVSGATSVIPPASCLGGTWFNGSTSKIPFTGMNALTGDITISFNCRLITWGGNADENGLLFYNGNTWLYTSSGGGLNFTRNYFTQTVTYGSISKNTDYNIVITSTSTGTTYAYINGVKSSLLNTGTPSSGTSWVIGANGSDGGNTVYGRISNMIIWTRILDESQISLLYQLGH